jgi:uncharacterized protein (TIGR00251 family)
MSELAVSERAGSVRFNVHVQPRASRTEITGIHGAALKLRLHSPPVDGAANDELIAFLAKSLGVARQAVRVIAGHASRGKTIEVEGVSPDSVKALTGGAGIR